MRGATITPQQTAYRSSEELQTREGGSPFKRRWRVHRLRQHQEGTRHQGQEEVEEEQGLKKQEVWEDTSAETAAHSLEGNLPQLEGVHEGQPAIPTVSGSLGGESMGEQREKNDGKKSMITYIHIKLNII